MSDDSGSEMEQAEMRKRNMLQVLSFSVLFLFLHASVSSRVEFSPRRFVPSFCPDGLIRVIRANVENQDGQNSRIPEYSYSGSWKRKRRFQTPTAFLSIFFPHPLHLLVASFRRTRTEKLPQPWTKRQPNRSLWTNSTALWPNCSRC